MCHMSCRKVCRKYDTGLDVSVSLTIHVIRAKMDITLIKQLACLVLTQGAKHAPTL